MILLLWKQIAVARCNSRTKEQRLVVSPDAIRSLSVLRRLAPFSPRPARQRRASNAMASRHSAISNTRPASGISIMSTRTPPRAAFSRRSRRREFFNQGLLTFNSLNSFILRGDAAQGIELTFASLMTRAYDEPD